MLYTSSYSNITLHGKYYCRKTTTAMKVYDYTTCSLKTLHENIPVGSKTTFSRIRDRAIKYDGQQLQTNPGFRGTYATHLYTMYIGKYLSSCETANTSLLWEEHISSRPTSHSLLSLSGTSSPLSSFIAAFSIIQKHVSAMYEGKVIHCMRTKGSYIKCSRSSCELNLIKSFCGSQIQPKVAFIF